jgi:hypothetical protein
MNDHNARDWDRHPDPSRRKTATNSPPLTNPPQTASRPALRLTRVITLGS